MNKTKFTEVEIRQAMVLHRRRREAEHRKQVFIAQQNLKPKPEWVNITSEQLRVNAIKDLQDARERRELFEMTRLQS